MRILVQKFGGSSVADLECMKKVRSKVLAAREEGYKLVVVLSARAGQTNSLLERAYQWSDEPDLAELDVLLTTGEQESVALFSMLLQDAGVKARSILGFQIPIITDDAFGSARIDSIDATRLRELLETYDVLVMAGFQGRTPDMRLTTLGRGGSDTSAVAIAAALGDDTRCDIYTDVDGVYTTDPRMCKAAHKLDRICYDEMLEMASMGAKVLQIRSVEIAEKYNVPVRVRSTFSNDPGTLVTKEDDMMESVLVSGIATDKDQARITLCDVQDRPGTAASIFNPLGEAGIVVDMIIQTASRNGVTDMAFTVSRKDLKRAIDVLTKAGNDASKIESSASIAKVSVVGVGMRNHSGVSGRVFDALYKAGINLIMISTSEVKISCLVDEADLELAVNVLHKEFDL
ncbi:MAG: aspartate kinase [Mailhella sp.]|nr:aspartate kinase [Mailhella sp.]